MITLYTINIYTKPFNVMLVLFTIANIDRFFTKQNFFFDDFAGIKN